MPRKISLHTPLNEPDPVVENSTLSAVSPPDIAYNLAMPASILSEGKLSDLQLEAIVYGCQRHTVDLPMDPELEELHPEEVKKVRAGFLLGDGAGMGKGRTLAGFVVENIARGRKKHVWVSVSSDLYEGKVVFRTNKHHCMRFRHATPHHLTTSYITSLVL